MGRVRLKKVYSIVLILLSSVVDFTIPEYEDEPEALKLATFSIMFAGIAGGLILSTIVFLCEFLREKKGRKAILKWAYDKHHKMTITPNVKTVDNRSK